MVALMSLEQPLEQDEEQPQRSSRNT